MAKPFKVRKTTPHDPAEAAAVRILRTRLREFYSHWPDPDTLPSAEQLHNQRISGKRLRYSAETLRELFPDKLALLIDLLKRQQDLLGSMQDIVTQQAMIASDLARRRGTSANRKQIEVLESILAGYSARYAELYQELENIWRGMSQKQFRRLLRRLVSRPSHRVRKPKPEPEVTAVTSPAAIQHG
jgi:CHAD domain-containing protein